MTTYREVAECIGLGKIDTARFIAYMTMRWVKDEYIQCMSGYATEWANRFLNGIEYQCSDLEGLKVLYKIDRCENCHEMLTSEGLVEAINNNLKLGEVSCDDCWQDFISQKYEESKHPDSK